MPDTQITITDIINEYGSYYINEGQNMSRILTKPFIPFGTRNALTNVPTKDTQLRYTEVELTEILQGYQDTFTPKGSATFAPVIINLNPMKVDQAFNPTKLVNTWLGFLTNNSVDRTTWPFIRWFIEVYILQKLQEDLEQKAIYKGVYVAPVEGTATPAQDVMNGIRFQINDAIDDEEIVPIPTGAPSADPVTWCEQVEEFVDAIPSKSRSKKMFVNMNEDLELRYKKGKRKKYNENYAQVADLLTLADHPHISVAGRASMEDSTKLWATPIENAVLGIKGFENANGFEIEKVDRKVKIYTDFWLGFGFLQKSLVFSNDQDLD